MLNYTTPIHNSLLDTRTNYSTMVNFLNLISHLLFVAALLTILLIACLLLLTFTLLCINVLGFQLLLVALVVHHTLGLYIVLLNKVCEFLLEKARNFARKLMMMSQGQPLLVFLPGNVTLVIRSSRPRVYQG